MKFNINEKVRVKLTEHGKALHREYHAKFLAHLGQKAPDYTPPKEDAEGWSEWQLWVLMQEFGPHMGLGFRTVIETEIEVPNVELTGGALAPSSDRRERG